MMYFIFLRRSKDDKKQQKNGFCMNFQKIEKLRELETKSF